MIERRVPSIELRLMLLLGAITLVVSSVAGYSLFWALKREVQNQEMTEVAGKLELIEHLIGMRDNTAQLDGLHASLENILIGHPTLKAWVLRPGGDVFFGEGVPRITDTSSDGEIFLHAADGSDMRGLRARLEGEPLRGAELIVATDVRPSAQFLYAFASVLVLIGTIWVGATVVLSAWAVRRSLASIKRFSAQAARIQPDSLAVRLSEQDTDRELREFVQSFNRMLDRLQAAYQQMEGFNADVAHELRTPLATLISGTEVALSAPRDTKELRDVLSSNLEELNGLGALINDMLFLARADGGELARDLQEVRVCDEISRVSEYYEAALEEAGVSLQARNDCEVFVNPRLFRRAISNLVSNAIKATPRGRSIEVDCVSGIHEVEIRVRNPGVPIPPEALERIFDRFYRTDVSRTGGTEGHGLGLAIVNAIARMHGGRASASSHNDGSEVRFSVALPITLQKSNFSDRSLSGPTL